MQGGEAGDWIRWAMAGAVSFVVGLVGGSWAARGMLDEMRQKAAVHEVRLAALELDRETIREMASNIAVLAALQCEMKDDVKEIFDRLKQAGG